MKRSETVGQSPVNRLVAGLNLARGANKIRQFLRSSKPQISKADLCIAKSQVRQGPSGPIHQNIVGQSALQSQTIQDCPDRLHTRWESIPVFNLLISKGWLRPPIIPRPGLSKREYSAGPKLGERL